MRAAHRLILHSKNSGLPHTIPMKLSGTCGSVSVRLIPAPRGTGLVAAPASKKILALVCGVLIILERPLIILERPRACQILYPTQHGGPRGLLLHDARPLAHDGQLHHRGLQRGLGLVRLPVARVMEAHGKIAASSLHFMDAHRRRESKI